MESGEESVFPIILGKAVLRGVEKGKNGIFVLPVIIAADLSIILPAARDDGPAVIIREDEWDQLAVLLILADLSIILQLQKLEWEIPIHIAFQLEWRGEGCPIAFGEEKFISVPHRTQGDLDRDSKNLLVIPFLLPLEREKEFFKEQAFFIQSQSTFLIEFLSEFLPDFPDPVKQRMHLPTLWYKICGIKHGSFCMLAYSGHADRNPFIVYLLSVAHLILLYLFWRAELEMLAELRL